MAREGFDPHEDGNIATKIIFDQQEKYRHIEKE
jgi:hypothetical protein